MTRFYFGVKSSLFLLAATIKHHLKKYVDIFPDTFNHLNQSLYVDDILCGNVSVQAALTTSIESKQILEDATTRGPSATDHVILNHGQVTWTTPELALPLNYRTTKRGGRFCSRQILTCIAALHGGSSVVLGSNS
ncbi:hypothetical protein TNCV_640561 [Trichonephila clavipes]|nr:hypothetical protein TNCV_640561 [Trichonephila clavipes]